MLSAVPSSGIVNSVIRITGIGDRDRPEWLIRINGMRNTHVMLGFCAVPARADATGGGWLMPSQSVENWERKAAQARHAASILLGISAKVTMLQMADHYWKLASAARQDIIKPVQSNDYQRTSPRRIPPSWG
jgi:hypothetical protein